MKTSQKHWTKEAGWASVSGNGFGKQAQLVFAFGETAALRQEDRLKEIRDFFPAARIIGCSTAGEIMRNRVYDDSISATGVFFEKTSLQFAETTLESMEDSFAAGERLAQVLPAQGLVHVFVLSDGLHVNGSALAKGLQRKLPRDVPVTGGMAGDQDRFSETRVFLDNISDKPTVAAVGFYGEALRVGYGSRGGWDSFGPDRLVTRAKANVLYELDGQSVLELYRKYLGELAQGLPATGLLFPLSLALEGGEQRIVRTILSINEEDGSMTFAGDIPEGSYARLMKANFEQLVEGATESAKQSLTAGPLTPDLAILISCVGRKLVLKQRVDEEVEGVHAAFGEGTAMTGFYSYGEICPVEATETNAELHNQTMTITTISEQ